MRSSIDLADGSAYAKKSTWNGAHEGDVISLVRLHPNGRGQQETEGRLDDVLAEVVFGKSFPNAVPQAANASLIASYIAGLFTMSGWMVLLSHLHPSAV